MKLGLGLYRHLLKPEHYRFARQAGATHIVAHLVNYYSAGTLPAEQAGGGSWGIANPHLWTVDELAALKADIEAEGLKLEAIENFDPGQWYDILLDGPRREEQIEGIKTILRHMGTVGIPVMGYSFSLVNVWGWSKGPWARGGAVATGWIRELAPPETPIPNGQVWNMTYDPDAPPGFVSPVSPEEIRRRFANFMREVVPVAEQAGVRLAAHPADPPLPVLRDTARLAYRPELYQEILDVAPSHYNALEYCVGTLSEMVSDVMDVYESTDTYSRQGKIAYVHLRNVHGKVPHYHEVFIDEGDTDMLRILEILYRNGFDGVIIPDHVPEMTCDAPWHAGMAHALGWIKASIQALERYCVR
ncbi:MAG: mannonate dehydratase [Chloroflexi bacterium]|nr:mannonate dehydratase [Chloroflexota bacterium]